MGRDVRGKPKQWRWPMAKKGVSLLVSAAGWIGGLTDKLIRELRAKGIPDEAIHALVKEEPDVLFNKIIDVVAEHARQLNASLPEHHPAEDVFKVVVNYEITVEEGVRRGKYDWKNGDITTEHFPTKRKGKIEAEIRLFHFNRQMTNEAVLEEMDKAGYRAAETHEMLALGEKYPEEQRKYPIAGLGSVWRPWAGDCRVVSLGESDDERGAGLARVEGHWDESWRFAGVRK
jgi:hypothetical protein